ncbi:MAG: DUF4837 family protein [Flavobacteriales bacterium]|nr:DUF4837 family protein [Flavobacteriales bacterium]
MNNLVSASYSSIANRLMSSNISKFKMTLLALVFFPSFILSGCGEPLTLEQMLPDSAGMTNEIYIFCNHETWNDTVGRYVNAELTKPLNNLPQPEAQFTLFQFDIDGATKARMSHRNIIEIEINDRNENKKTRIVKSKDVWAKGQLLYKFKGQNEKDILALMEVEIPFIIEEIKKKELERYRLRFASKPNLTIQRKLKEERGINLTVPHKLNLQENREGFAWLEAKGLGPEGKRVLHQGIFVYHYPYTDDSTFTYDFLIAKRDEVLKANVPGSSDDQYLETLILPGKKPTITEFDYNGEYAIEMRGEFSMHNGFMGGPFVSITTFDKANGRIVTVEGYCYAPLLKKRDFLTEMEAVVYSTTFDPLNVQGQ